MTTESRATVRWWLGLQVTLTLTGGSVWLGGAILEHDFVSGVGCGMLIGALALRLGRSAAKPDA